MVVMVLLWQMAVTAITHHSFSVSFRLSQYLSSDPKQTLREREVMPSLAANASLFYGFNASPHPFTPLMLNRINSFI